MVHSIKFWATFSLRKKLIAMGVGLAIIPSLVIGGLGLQQFRGFSQITVEQSHEGLTRQAMELLTEGVLKDHQRVKQLLEQAEQELQRFSTQSVVTGYFPLEDSINELDRANVLAKTTKTMNSVLQIILSQKRLIFQKLKADIAVADYILESSGGLEQEGLTVEWQTMDPVTKKVSPIVLPLLQIGFDTLSPEMVDAEILPVVDRVETLVGSTCTLFQQMNPGENLLTVATTARTRDGHRALGENILTPGQRDGTSRISIAGDYYMALFKELVDIDATPVGMISVGIKESDLQGVEATIMNTRLGSTGYLLIMDSSDTIIFHPDPSMVGINVHETGIPPLSGTIASQKGDAMQLTEVKINGREGFAMGSCLPDSDWVVVAVGFWEDFQPGQTTMDHLTRELNIFLKTARVRVNGTNQPLFSRVTVVDSENRIIAREGQDGVGSADLPCLAVPIVIDGKSFGTVSAKFNWPLVWETLRYRIYGKSGYAYVTDSGGKILSGPGNKPEQKGETTEGQIFTGLAHAMEEMSATSLWQGKSVDAGIDHYGAAKRLSMGKFDLIVGAIVPAGQFLELADAIKHQAQKGANRVMMILGVAIVAMVILGTLLGIFLAMSVVNPIVGIINRVRKIETSGDLTLELSLPKTAELRNLASCINSFIRTLKSVVEGIRRTSDNMEKSSSDLTDVSRVMTGATEQGVQNSTRVVADSQCLKDHLEAVTGSMDIAAANVSAMAVSTNLIKETLVDIAKSCARATAETHDAVVCAGSVSIQVKILESAAEQINSVTSSINDISRQTNLLALNATIEASRVGHVENGFGVIANEIKALSQQTELATRDIKTRIQEIQEATWHTVEAIQTTDKAIHSVNKIMGTITESVEEQAVTFSKMASNSALASSMIDDVRVGVNKSSSLSSATAETIAAMNRSINDISRNSDKVMVGADNQADQAGQIRAMVHWFRLG